MSADVFENAWNKCLKIYGLNTCHFLTVLGLTWQAAVLTNIDMLLMIEKGTVAGICHAVHQYVKINNNCMKDW